ncbi:phage portal protein [Thioalkalivibrio sp. ALJ15]|uniref:phage portal protein n=1 Tax=Thioalkalivibrio sp. ALJ15 TaxID=748652 RepID=UPI00037F63FF|nr:phage portal protein [Thioalkalivibrio sp. ALJ15]
MGLLRRMAEYFEPETRDQEEPSWDYLSGHNTVAPVNARVAENLSTVLACVGAISGSIASLPTYIYRREGDNRVEDPTHPLGRLIHLGPNRWQTWPDFVEWLLASTLLRGNGLAEIVTDHQGQVVELRPIPWDWVAVQLLPNGRLAYDVTELTSVYGGTGRMRRLLQDEVLHLRDRTDDGLLGRSRLTRAAAAVGAALSTQEFAGSMWKNGANPSGAIKVPAKLDTDQRNEIRKGMEAFKGAANAHKMLILEAGMEWESISMNPEDAELLASRKFSVEELARIYGVPPPIIGDLTHGTFTNAETVGRWFAQQTLSLWIRKLEAEMVRSVFSETSRATHMLDFDLSGFQRGDPESRWTSHKIAKDAGILTANEIRQVEGWNPLPGGNGLETNSPVGE